MIPVKLTWWTHPVSGVSYEVWHTPNARGGRYHVYFFSRGIEINAHAYGDEISARKSFERLVEQQTYAEGR